MPTDTTEIQVFEDVIEFEEPYWDLDQDEPVYFFAAEQNGPWTVTATLEWPQSNEAVTLSLDEYRRDYRSFIERVDEFGMVSSGEYVGDRLDH